MTLFHTWCETLHRSGGGRMKVNERRTVVDWPLCAPPHRGERSTRMHLHRVWKHDPLHYRLYLENGWSDFNIFCYVYPWHNWPSDDCSISHVTHAPDFSQSLLEFDITKRRLVDSPLHDTANIVIEGSEVRAVWNHRSGEMKFIDWNLLIEIYWNLLSLLIYFLNLFKLFK